MILKGNREGISMEFLENVPRSEIWNEYTSLNFSEAKKIHINREIIKKGDEKRIPWIILAIIPKPGTNISIGSNFSLEFHYVYWLAKKSEPIRG